MWFTFQSHNRQSSISGERRRMHGSRRQRLACRPTIAVLEDRWLLSTLTVTSNSDSGTGSPSGPRSRRWRIAGSSAR